MNNARKVVNLHNNDVGRKVGVNNSHSFLTGQVVFGNSTCDQIERSKVCT